MYQNDHSTRNAVLIGLAVLAVVALLLPLVLGYGRSIGVGQPDSLQASAQLQVALGELAKGQAVLETAKAESYRGLSTALSSAPEALTAASGLAVNLGIMFLVLGVAYGIARLIGAFAHTVQVYADLKKEVVKADVQIRLLSGGVTDAHLLAAGAVPGQLPAKSGPAVSIPARARDTSISQPGTSGPARRTHTPGGRPIPTHTDHIPADGIPLRGVAEPVSVGPEPYTFNFE